MKTIVFFSYKGGTGRTLALANAAICFAKMGKNIAVIDLDFEAPGLQFKLGARGGEPNSKGGAVEYVYHHINKARAVARARHNDAEGALAADIEAEPIDDWTMKLQPKKSAEGPVGTIHLIRAGNVFSDEYWGCLETREWSQVFSLAQFDADVRERNLTFLADVKSRVAELDPKPDYFLVDCRSGIGEFENLTLGLWADTLLFFFNNSEETVQSLQWFVERFRGYERGPHRPLNFVPVISRIPSGLDDPQAAAIEADIRGRLLRPGESLPLCILHSDRQIETRERLRIPLDEPTPNKRLAHEYVHLCAVAMNSPDYDPRRLEQTEAEIRKAIELDESEEEEDRVFSLSRIRGTMVNPHDAQPNVSLKTETFVRMLNVLHEEAENAVYETGGNREEAQHDVDRMYRAAGLSSGQRFGGAMLHDWLQDGPLMEKDARVRNWCRFDSDVGFGRFEFFPKGTYPEDGDGDAELRDNNVIRITNNFVTYLQKPQDANLCLWMEGYIEGVLQKILKEPKVQVKHPEGHCERLHNERDNCEFYF